MGWRYTIPSHTKYESSFPSGYVFDHVEYAWNGNNHGYVTEGQTIDIYGTGMAVYFVLKADSSSGGSGGGTTTSPGDQSFTVQIMYRQNSSDSYGPSGSVTLNCGSSSSSHKHGYTCYFTVQPAITWANNNKDSAYTTYLGWKAGQYGTLSKNSKTGSGSYNQTIYVYYEKPVVTYSATITYNANGGSVTNMPSPNPQTVSWTTGEDNYSATVSSTIPKRDGYEFKGWAYDASTSPDATWLIQPGGQTAVQNGGNSTIYAIWKQTTTTYYGQLVYNGNSGGESVSGMPSAPGVLSTTSTTKQIATSVDSAKPTRSGYTFAGWNTNQTAANNGTVEYVAGASITIPATSTDSSKPTKTRLYAVWKSTTASYTVEWVDTLGNTLKKPETRGPSTVGGTVSADSGDKTINGYDYVASKSTESATLAASGTKLTLKFQPKKPALEVLYQTTFDLLCDDKSLHTRTMKLVAQGSNGEYNEWNPDWCTYSSEVTESNGTYTWTATLHASYWVNWYGNHDKTASQAEDVPVTFTWDASSGKWVAPSGDIVIHMQGHKTTYTWKNSVEDGGNVWKTVDVSDCLTAPTYDGQTPTKAEDDNYTYTFEKWSDPVTEADGSKVYTAQYTKTPKTPATITLDVNKDNSAEDGHGFDAVDGKLNTSKVSYTVTVTNGNPFDVSGLDIIDALATTIQNGNTQSNDAKITLANVAFTLQNPGDEKAQPITGVTGPTSNTYANNATPPDPDKGGKHANKLTWNVLPKGTVFKSGAVVTLTYDILVENDSYDDLSVNLNNKVFAGTWRYTPPAPANRMMKAAARSGGYDGSGSASSGASNNVTGSIPGKCPIEVKKDANVTTVNPGATVTYTVTIKNLSSTAKDLVITDVMDSGLTMVEGSLSVTGSGALLPGDPGDPVMIMVRGEKTATVTYQATVGSDVAVGTQLKNTFTATVEGTTKSDSGTATVTVKKPGTYIVTFKPNNGKENTTETVTEGGKATKPTDPTKENAVFAGWVKEGETDLYDFDTVLTGDITLVAQWEDDTKADPNQPDGNGDKPGDGIPDDWQYTVTYTAVGGTVSFESTVVTKLDNEGKPSASGTAKLAAGHIPTSEPDTSNGYAGTGSWSASEPVVGTVITEDTTFTVTFQKTEGSITVTVKDTDGTDKGTWKTDPDKDKTLTPDSEGKVTLPKAEDITPPDGKVLEKWKDQDGKEYNPGEEIKPDKDLTLVPVWKDIGSDETLTADVKNVTATYDGQGHPVTDITVTDGNGNPVGYTITYNTPDGNAPVDAGTYTATVKVGGKEVGKEATVTIGRRSVTITSGSASKTYDGTALTSHRVTVTGDGFVTGQGATYTFTGSQTTVNSSPNYFSYQLNGNTNPANYSISLAYGTLTVNNRPTTPTTPPGGGGGGGGTYRPSTGGGGGGGTTGGSTVDIGDEDVPLAGGSELNREDHFAYVSGYEDGTVRPTNNITREEVAAIFYRLLTETSRTIYETDVNDFSDVNSGRWSNRAISTLTNAGIISGYEDGSFRPGQSITRAEFATIAAQFEVVTEDVENPFSDTTGHWAESLISFTAAKGWVGGYTDGTFKPQKAITRAEAMTLVNNVLEREVDEEGLLADAKQWPDNKKDAWYYYEVLEATNSHDYTRRGSGTVENWTAITND